MFHLKAIELISQHLRESVEEAKAHTGGPGRENMALAQYIAGMGFSNVGLGIAHSMAHTLGATYDTPHGVACAMALPIVMEFNAPETGERLRDVGRAMGVAGIDGMPIEEARAAAIAAVRTLGEDVGIPKKVEAMREEDLDFLSESAVVDACTPGNPRNVTAAQIKELFKKLM